MKKKLILFPLLVKCFDIPLQFSVFIIIKLSDMPGISSAPD